MLRLLFVELLDVLWNRNLLQGPSFSCAAELEGVSFSTFHGTKLTLEGVDFWVHLNYHLIHLLDFMPTQNYDRFAVQDGFTRLFVRLHEFLRNEGKLLADVRLDRLAQVPVMTAENQDLPTWDHLISNVNKDDVTRAHAQLGVQLREYSKAINHDLSYEIHWK